MSRRFLVAALSLTVIAACGADPAPAPAPASPPLVGFGSYGPLRLGMDRAAVLAAAPVPLAESGTGPSCTFLADKRVAGGDPYGSLQVTLDRTGRVIGISPPANARTDRGIAAGSTADQVRTAYPEPVVEGTNETGRYLAFAGPSGGSVGFTLDGTGTVTAIRAGTSEYAQGFEVCSDA